MGVVGSGVWLNPMDHCNVALPLEGALETSNRAELTACIKALRAVPASQPHGPSPIVNMSVTGLSPS